MEYSVLEIEICRNRGSIVIVISYNPSNRLMLAQLDGIDRMCRGRKVIWCGDFNAHDEIWGSKYKEQWKYS